MVAGKRCRKLEAVWEKGVARGERPRWQRLTGDSQRQHVIVGEGVGGQWQMAEWRPQRWYVILGTPDGGVTHERGPLNV